jgi:hypothetical protein
MSFLTQPAAVSLLVIVTKAQKSTVFLVVGPLFLGSG